MGRARENCRITCKIHGLIYGEPQRLNHECVHIVTSVAENRSLKKLKKHSIASAAFNSIRYF
ncbi:Protein of unknown function [Pyronema omphalodes CBS 100304]|uniref:Uncharacterized protein n=1 Tax=Pyronema omphalodes (strain CBS 100304) TaxID=1076935 RepID=U4KVD5_PYROM|nr:Protein of unknown function [Pyronema omphalodes CBS 100304]